MIDAIGDIKSVNEVLKYDVVLCDIMGVGKYLDPRLQGASIIAEVRRSFPEKYVIAYTGAALNQVAARQANALADDTLKKDADIEDWIGLLDKYMNASQDPFKVWIRIRSTLIDRGVDTKDVLCLEDAYVRSIKKGDAHFIRLTKQADKLRLRDDVRSIINGIISSIAFSYMFGS